MKSTYPVSLTPVSTPFGDRIVVSIPTQSDYHLVSGEIRASFAAPNASGSVVVPCAFNGAGIDSMGAKAFFLLPPQGAQVPAGPYVAVLEIG